MIDPRILGASVGEVELDVTPRWTKSFAAGIPDPRSLYYDDRADALVAPPTFPCALTWRLSRLLPGSLDPVRVPPDGFRRQLHVLEKLEIERPIRPGDRVRITGHVMAVIPKSSGCLFAVRYHGTAADGALLFREIHCLMLQDVRVDGEGGTLEPLPDIPAPDPVALVWHADIPIQPLACYVYDACADIDFDVHTSIAYAERNYGSPPVLHGTCSVGLALREIVRWAAHDDPRRVASVSARFTAPILQGTTLSLSAGPVEGAIAFALTNPDGRAALLGRVALFG